MTARYIPCHKCFPKASTSVTLSADKKKKKPPHKPLMKCASYFFWMCQQFLAGWSDTTSWRCLLCLCHRVHAHVCVWGVVFVVAYVDLNIFTFFALLFLLFLHGAEGKKAMSFFHNLIRGYTQERAAAAWTSLIMLMRSPGYVVIEV